MRAALDHQAGNSSPKEKSRQRGSFARCHGGIIYTKNVSRAIDAQGYQATRAVAMLFGKESMLVVV